MEFELKDAPSDGVSRLEFCPGDNRLLLATSWDRKSRVYDVRSNSICDIFEHESPVLDGCFISTEYIVSGGLDGKVIKWNLNNTKDSFSLLATHSQPVKSIVYNATHQAVISGGWDCTVRISDVRMPDTLANTIPQAVLGDQERVYSMDTSDNGDGNKLIVATAGRIIYQYDLRNFPKYLCQRESSLRHQTRCIRLSPSTESYVTSSIEGRVSVDRWDPKEEGKKFAFKCHRVSGTDDSGSKLEHVYPVNALTFHPVRSDLLATGGGDGSVSIWDIQTKKRLKHLPSYPTSISSLSFSIDGSMLAIASSYTYEQGEKDHPPDSIFVKPFTE